MFQVEGVQVQGCYRLRQWKECFVFWRLSAKPGPHSLDLYSIAEAYSTKHSRYSQTLHRSEPRLTMSLTPSTAKCDSQCLDFAKIGTKRKGSDLESFKISQPRLSYSVGDTAVHLEGLAKVLRRLSKDKKLRLVRVNDGSQVPIEAALYCGQFGVVEISSG